MKLASTIHFYLLISGKVFSLKACVKFLLVAVEVESLGKWGLQPQHCQ